MTTIERELAARDAYGLSQKEAALFVALAEGVGRTVTYEHLAYRIYGRAEADDITIRWIKKRMTKRLPDDLVVSATYGAGYRLTAPKKWVPPWA